MSHALTLKPFEAPEKTRPNILRDRALMLAVAREFFAKRKILEVDCPILTKGASIDAHIDLIPATYNGKEIRYLHSSPEYGMKRLLSEGIGDIYQLSHVFRDGEHGQKHNPEFTMAEWYRIGITFEEMIAETLDFIRLFVGDLPAKTYSYRELFQEIGIDYLKATNEKLLHFLSSNAYPNLENEGRDALLNLILATFIEPKLGREELSVLAYYPHSQAALAKTVLRDGELLALRFEVYYQGVELANGYQELLDAKEQRNRFLESNHHRKLLNKAELPLDEEFLKSLEKGLPECCGVAVGFDRLMMLRHQAETLSEVIPFDWSLA